MLEILRQKIADALASAPPEFTRRGIHLPSVRGKALAVAATQFPRAVPLVLGLDSIPPQPGLSPPLQWQPVASWLLEPPAD